MLQTFTCCTFPQAKERTRDVRSLTLFSRLEILTSFTCLFAKFPACQIVLSWLPCLRSVGVQPQVSYLPMPLHLPHQWYCDQWASILHRNIEWVVDQVSDDEGIECTIAQIVPNTQRVSLHEIVESHIFLSLCWQIEILGNTFQGKSSSCHSKSCCDVAIAQINYPSLKHNT